MRNLIHKQVKFLPMKLFVTAENKGEIKMKKAIALLLTLVLSINFACADTPDFTKAENYLPGEKYRIYGQGRGEVAKLRGGVHLSGGMSSINGSFGRETDVYDGKIQYEQVFNDHKYWEHGPFDSTQTANFSNTFATVSDGFVVNRVTIKARELHPADGYEGEPDPNGRFPAPSYPRDEYTYEVHGASVKIKPVYPDKPKTLPENPQNIDWSGNEPFSEALTDSDIERIREYLNSYPNAEGIPNGLQDAKQQHDLGNWDNAEVGQPENADNSSWADAENTKGIDWVDVTTDFIPIVGDVKSFVEAETGVDYAIATAGIILKPVKALKTADKVADAANAVKKAEKAADKAEDVAGNASKIEPYNRQKHYGGSQTNSSAAQEARKAGEGQPCPTCGKTQISGTSTAPSPQHEPPLVKHYYEYGGSNMTTAERKAYAQNEGIKGTQCLTCQRKEGGRLSKYAKDKKKGNKK